MIGARRDCLGSSHRARFRCAASFHRPRWRAPAWLTWGGGCEEIIGTPCQARRFREPSSFDLDRHQAGWSRPGDPSFARTFCEPAYPGLMTRGVNLAENAARWRDATAATARETDVSFLA